jgi:hypothetical protein
VRYRLPGALGSFLLAAFTSCASHSDPPPPSAAAADGASREEAIQAAVEDLAKKVGAPVSEIALESREEANWSNSCLGCATSGEICKQVVTPGYRLILRVRGAAYEYHTNRTDRARLCDKVVR